MQPKKLINHKQGPEAKIQAEIIKALLIRRWYVKETHGNMYQSGLPDLFCTHHKYGHRWVEVKNPLHYVFTPAQVIEFPLICANGSGVWVLTAATDDEIAKLHGPFNWHFYLSSWKV
jgi:hypothetical protein